MSSAFIYVCDICKAEHRSPESNRVMWQFTVQCRSRSTGVTYLNQNLDVCEKCMAYKGWITFWDSERVQHDQKHASTEEALAEVLADLVAAKVEEALNDR